MTDRVIVYPLTGAQDVDMLRSQIFARRGLHYLARMVLTPQAEGGIVWNFVPQSVNGYSLTLSDGVVVGPLVVEDTTDYGSLPPSAYGNTPVYIKPDTTVLTFVPPSGAGNSVYHVVYVTLASADTDLATLYYLNTDDPSQPFRGVGNNGEQQPTTRRDAVTLNVAVGTEAATGTQAMPPVPVGAIPLYAVLVNYNEALQLDHVTQHPASPFYPGIQQIFGGNPNGYVAGTQSKAQLPPSMCYDYSNNIWYTCTQTGNAQTAVWVAPAVNTGPRGDTGIGVIGLSIRGDAGNILHATYSNGVEQDIGTIPAGPPGPPGAAGPAGLYSGTLISSTVFTPDTGGLFVPTINTNRLRITCVGSGGSGAGSIVNAYSGGGGGSGATCIAEIILSDNLAGVSPNRAALSCYPGRGGIAGQVGLAGYTGGDSVVTAAGVELMRAHSGQGGQPRIGATGPAGGLGGVAAINPGPYSAGVQMSFGRVVLAFDGGDGGDGQMAAVNGTTQFGGNGGSSSYGGAGRAGIGGGLPGKRNTGGGGGGAYASTAVGGVGGDGVIIIDEYH